MNRRFSLLSLIEKAFYEKTYKKAREKEKELPQDEFTAYYLPRTIIYWFLISLIFVAFAILFKWLNADKILVILLIVGAICSFLISIYHFTYRCFVNDEGMQIMCFWVIKKRVFWREVYKVDVKRQGEEYDKAEEKDIIIRNKKNKIIFSCPFDLVGFTLIIKKAKKERKKLH